jgi:hypothetical protein
MSFNPAEMLVPGTMPMSEPNVAIKMSDCCFSLCNRRYDELVDEWLLEKPSKKAGGIVRRSKLSRPHLESVSEVQNISVDGLLHSSKALSSLLYGSHESYSQLH